MGTSSTGIHLWVAVCLALLQLLAGTVTASRCAAGCKGGASNYPAGQVLVYKVEGTTRTNLPDTKEEAVTLQFHANAEVSAAQDCSVALKLKDVRVTGPNGKKYDSLRELEQYPVSFTSVDGKVDGYVCAAEAENIPALNIKRAVISLLRVFAKQSGKVYDWDVFGKCPSSVIVDGGEKDFTVSLTRDLNECYRRESINHRLKSTPYYTQSGVQSSPLLMSKQSISQKVVNGYVQTASSTETYLFRPLSNQDTGAKTVVETTLKLKSQHGGAVNAGGVSVSRPIVFELPRDGSSGEGSADALVKALKQAADTMPQTVNQDSAKEFRSLVKVVRRASKDDLLTVYSQVKSGAGFSHSPKKLYQDALLQAGTGETIEVAVELMKNNEIKGDLARLWYISFPLVRQPSVNSLAAVSTLLDEPDLSYHAYFGIGSLAGRYCSSHNCEGDAVFAGLLNKLARSIAGGCKVSSRDQEDKLIISLKALGNVRQLTDSVSTIVQRCYADSSAASRVRVAALETALTDACKHKMSALSLLQNTQEDSELRIKAYLIMAQCPDGKIANSLKQILEKESINQVGSYIVSHLRNLRASTNPERQAAKEQLGEIRSPHRFPVDIRKYSRNMELSYLFEGLNIGASLDSNVIFSQRSYVPRSLSLNLTTEVFGHAYNIFELGLRAENLERLLERNFGPKGFYSVSEPEEVIQTNKGRFYSLVEQVKQRFQQTTSRTKRSTKQLSSTLKRATKSLGPDYDDNHIDLDLSTKLFGSEMGWKNFGGNVEDFTPEQAIDKIFNTFDDGVKQSRDINVDMRNHGTFMEVEMIYPIAWGMPLKMITSGSAAVHVKVNSNLDLVALIKDYNNVDMRFNPEVSGAVAVTGELLIDAYAVESGLKVEGQLHSKSGVDVKIRGSEGKKLDVQVGMPMQKQELINFKSTVVSTVRERDGSEHDKELTFRTDRKEYQGCFDQLSSLVGLTFCSSVSVPWQDPSAANTFYPFNGPASLFLQVEAKDVPYYHLVIQKNLHGQYEGVVQLLFDTPGSQTNRKLELSLTRVLEPEYKLAVDFISPRRILSASVYELDNAQEYSWNAKFKYNEQEYSARVGAKKSGSASHQVYTPLLEYRTPAQSHQLSGGSTDSGFGCKGTVTVDKTDSSQKYTLQGITVQTPKGSVRVDGTLIRQKNQYESDLKFTIDDDVFKYKSKFVHTSPSKFTVELQGQSSKHPEWGVDFKWNYHREKNSVENSVVVTHGRDLRSDQNRITLQQSAKYKFENSHNFNLEGQSKAEYPLFGINLEAKGAATPKTLNYDLDFEYEKYKFGSELDFKRGSKQPGDFDIEFSVDAGDKGIEFDLKREVTGKDKSKITAELEIKPSSKYKLSSEVVHTIRQNDINLHHSTVLTVSDRQDDIKFTSGFVMNHNEFEILTEISSGKKRLDFKLTLNKAAENPYGNIKVFVNGLVDANAQYKYVSGGKVGATLNIDLPKQGRKIKGTADLTITGTNHVASLDLFWDMGRDPSRKLHFSTQSDIKANSIDSKNSIILLEDKISLNFKGSLIGKFTNGHLTGEMDLTMPKGEQFVFKVDRNLKRTEDKIEFEAKGEVTLRDAQGGTNSLSTSGKLVAEFKNVMIDGFLRLAGKTSKGKDLSVYLKLKDVPAREKRELEGQLDIESSQLEPLKLGASADVTQKEVIYKSHFSYGSDIAASMAGTFGRGKGGKVVVKDDKGVKSVTFTIENILDLKLATDKIRTVKYTTKVEVASERNKNAKISSVDDLIVNGDTNYKLSFRLDAQPSSGNSWIEICLPTDKPRSIATTWHFSTQNEILKKEATLNAKWGDKQEAVTTIVLTLPKDKSGIEVHITANTPKLGTADLTFKSKASRVSPKFIEVLLITAMNDKKVEMLGKVSESSFKFFPNMDVKVVSEQGTSRIYVNLKKKSETEVAGDSELQWTVGKGGRLTLNGEAKLESINNFYLELNADSEALQLNKWIITAQSKRAKGKNQVQLSATSAGKNVLDGRMNYNHVEKQNYHQFVAAGNVKFYDKQTQAKLDASISRFTKEANKQDGSEVKVKFNLGEKTYEGIYRLTDHELYVYNEICKKQGHCSLTQLNSKIETDEEKNQLNHHGELIIDMRNIGVPERIELTSTTELTQNVPFDHKVEMKLKDKQEIIYKAHVYVNRPESGIVITLPHRVIAGKVQTQFNFDENTSSVAFSSVGNLWLDQTRQPDLKTTVYLKYKADVKDAGITVDYENKLTHPSLGKDLSIKGKAVILGSATNVIDGEIVFDVFLKSEQSTKITVRCTKNIQSDGGRIDGAVKIFSKGLNLDVQLNGYSECSANGIDSETTFSYIDVNHATKQLIAKLLANKNGLTIKMKGPDSYLLTVDGKVQRLDDGTVKTHAVIALVDIQPVVLIFDTTYTTVFIQLYKQRLPEAKVEASVVADLFSHLALRADTINKGVKKELINIQMSLTEDNFLKTEVDWSTENFLKFVDVCTSELDIRNHLKQAAISLGKEAETELKDLASVLRQAKPNLKPLIQSYQKQLKELKEELVEDEGIKEMSQYISKQVARIRQAVAEILEKLTEALHVVTERLEKLQDSGTEAWEKLLPEFRKSYEKAIEVLNGVYEDVETMLLAYIHAVGKIIQNHEEDLKKFVAVFTDILEEFGKVIGKFVIQCRNDVKAFVDTIKEHLKSLPKFDALKEKLKQMKEEIGALQLPEQIWIVTEELIIAAKDTAPTPELKDFIDSLQKYIEKHMSHEKLDELDELKTLATKAAVAIKSLVSYVKDYLGEAKEKQPTLLGFKIPTTLADIVKIPQLFVFHFSPLKYFTSGDLPTLKELLVTYRPRLNPLDWFPPYKAIGAVIDGQHFFTFDRRHFTFRGSCPYILVTDVVDSNFSVVLKVENGKFKSLLLTDEKNSIEVQEDRTLLVDGQPSEYPAQAGGLSAWRRYHSLAIRSDSGVIIEQDYETGSFIVRLSGFYFGRTRGLLGTLSYEQGDDFLQSNGELTENVNDFANSWKVGQCQDVPGAAHTAPKASLCTEFFSSGSSLSLAFPFIIPVAYREACDQAVQSAGSDDAKTKAACEIAKAYVVTAFYEDLFVKLPDKCGQCEVVGQSRVEAGTKFSVRTAHAPHKAADIVIVLEQSLATEELFKELVTPLAQALTSDLKSRGITDVVIHLMGWSEKQRWPQHFTTGGKLVFDGSTKNIRFYNNREPLPRETDAQKIQWIFHEIQLELSLTHLGEATWEILNYPYRAGSSKALIFVTGQPAEVGKVTNGLIQTVGAALVQQWLYVQGIYPFVITPVEGLKISSKDAKALKNIVGFDDEHVYSLTDGKRKQGNTELRKLLDYKSNPLAWLPQGADGITFVAQNFIANKPQRRQYVQTVSHRISESLTSEVYEDCVCFIKDGINAESFCRVTGRKERETKSKPRTKG